MELSSINPQSSIYSNKICLNPDEIITSQEQLENLFKTYFFVEFSLGNPSQLILYETKKDYEDKNEPLMSKFPINGISITLYSRSPGSVGNTGRRNIIYLGQYDINGTLWTENVLKEILLSNIPQKLA
ncbi:MAG: hypothetical protein Q8K60_01055 [Parachlamydiaceae bacterium]|nr:hypothetical protein [Parachlamydiaceae bacterium]